MGTHTSGSQDATNEVFKPHLLDFTYSMDMLKRNFTGIPVFHGKNHRFLWIQTSFSHLFTNGEAEQRWHIVRHFAKMQRLSLQVAAEFLDGKKRGGVKM